MREILLLLLKGALLFFAIVGCWTISLPLYADLAVFCLLVLIYYRASIPALMCLTGSLGCTLVALNIAVLLIFGEPALYYREHEKHLGHTAYKPLVRDRIEMQRGDLVAIDSTLPISVWEPRTVDFFTDSLGYRNLSDYSNESIVLAGDSFIVGNGIDWHDTVPALLREVREMTAYSIAFPGDPEHYLERAVALLSQMTAKSQFIFFFYEGNDFSGKGELPEQPGATPTLPENLASYLNKYDASRQAILREYASQLLYPTLMFNMSRRAEMDWLFQRAQGRVRLIRIDRDLMGFFDPQSSATTAPHVELMPFEIRNPILERTPCVFMLPTKLRVYKEWLPVEYQNLIKEPAPATEALNRKFNNSAVRVVDLTPALRAEARRLMVERKYVYWRDDTHWNGNGTRAVLKDICDCICSSKAAAEFKSCAPHLAPR